MRVNFWPLFLVLTVSLISVGTSNTGNDRSSNDEELFAPTREWQVVKKGQKIPRGLHVRMNLETGMTEAKMLEENENKKTKAVAEVPDAGGESRGQNLNSESAGSLKYSEAELKEALKNIKSDDASGEVYSERVASKFRSYEELKKDLGDLNLIPKTDAEVISELVTEYKELTKETAKQDFLRLSILEDLEFLVHQIDNANEFIKLNGFKQVIYHSINSTNPQVKQEGLKLIGSSVQNNAKVQIHALETGSIGLLLRVLALDSDNGVRNRAIFAISGLLRRFPLAQLQFIENAGLSVFAELLDKSGNIKIQLKIVTLINDLILEHEFSLQDSRSSNHSEKVRQYNLINLKHKLKDYSWCQKLPNLLINVIKIDSNDHDSIERCLHAIKSIVNTCDSESTANMKSVVLELQKQYKSLASMEVEVVDEEFHSNYFTHLFDLCSEITGYLSYKYKSEL